MDSATAVIVAAIIGGVFNVIVKIIEKRPSKTVEIEDLAGGDDKVENKKKRDVRGKKTSDEVKNKKVGIRGQENVTSESQSKKKIFDREAFDLPSLLRMGIVFFLVIAFLQHTGIVFITPIQISNDSCPDRQNIQTAKDLEIKVKNGYVAYFMGWEFDGEDGGYFVTFKGPYKGTHSFNNGIYCPPIPEETELSQKTIDMLMVNCQQSSGRCSAAKICTQNIFAYHIIGGKCYE